MIGAPFILMEHIDGFTPVAPLPAPFDHDPAARRALGTELVDALAELALVDWRAVGLDGFGKPDGFLARQVDRWLWQLDSYRSRDIPELDTVTAWLRGKLPDPGPTGIMHGDYSMFNVMFAHGAPAHLAAILDWDTATIGEPLMDLGHVLARWDEAGEEPTMLGSADEPNRSDLSSRAELAARYAERTGFDLADLRYYEVLSLFKLGCIMEGHYATAVQQGDPTGGQFTRHVPRHHPRRRSHRTGGAHVSTPDLRERRRAFTADEIERVAIELFAARGFAEVTVDDIADAAGISPRTFFRYFPTKAHVVRAHQRRLVDRLVRALAARPPDEGPVTALHEALLATSSMRTEDRDRILVVGQLLSNEDIAADVGFEASGTAELVAMVGERAGLDPGTDLRPAVIVATMMGAAQAAFRAWADGGGTIELTTIVSGAVGLVTQGLARLDQTAQRPRKRKGART